MSFVVDTGQDRSIEVKKSLGFYRWIGHRSVTGWLAPEVMEILAVIDARQYKNNVEGSVAEIGVHHGRLFIVLNLLRRNGEKAVAVDVFGDQDLNIDQSGKGDLARFRANVDRWSSLDGVVIHEGDSTKLDAISLCGLVGGKVRLFSVDGGHTDSIVFSDMNLAEGSLVGGGVVIADDVFNQDWPGVATGTLRYLEGASLAPFAIALNKVFFAFPEYAEDYRQSLQSHFAKRYLETIKISEYAGHKVLVISRVPRRPRALLGRSQVARNVYSRLSGTSGS